jgi:hypothetical protein
LEHGSEAAPLNTGTMNDPTTPADTLLASFRTIRVPAANLIRPTPVDVWVAAAQWRAEKHYADEYRDLLGRFLTEGGHRFLTYLEEDPDGGWRLHSSPVMPPSRTWRKSRSENAAQAILSTSTLRNTSCGAARPIAMITAPHQTRH